MSTLLKSSEFSEQETTAVIAVVIPCYRVRQQIASVLHRVGPEVSHIYCIDDACPERSREIIEEMAARDSRIQLIVHKQNQGVGGAVLAGYRQAVNDGVDFIVKIDGDGQISPEYVPRMIGPLVRGEADYVKGNRFYQLEGVRQMPWVRIVGNAGLSFLTKLSTGYWSLFDPTNGLTAIHAEAVRMLPVGKIHRRYFFESDMLFRLNTIRAVVKEVPMAAQYGDETSSLNVTRTLFEFPVLHMRNLLKRLFYNYYLRNFSLASLNLIFGGCLMLFGFIIGITQWIESATSGVAASAGTVMLAGLPILVGLQLKLNFLGFDMANEPVEPLQLTFNRDTFEPNR